MNLSTPVVAMAQRLADTLGIPLEAAVAVALQNLEENITMKTETEWSVQEVAAEAKAPIGLVLEPHAEKQRIGKVLRTLGYKRRQIRFRGNRLLRWFAPIDVEAAQ